MTYDLEIYNLKNYYNRELGSQGGSWVEVGNQILGLESCSAQVWDLDIKADPK